MATKPCRYCASEIPSKAVLCHVCKSYQATWRNNLLFAAGAAGFITLIAGALSFTVHQIAETYKQVLWRDKINVLELSTGPSPHLRVVLSNGGDGPVFASQVVVYWRSGSYRYPIDRTVGLNSIEIVDNLQPGDPKSPLAKYDSYVGNSTGTPSAQVIAKAEISSRMQACFLPTIFDESNNDLSRMKEHYAAGSSMLATERAEARILFFSAHSGARIESKVPVVAAFLRLGTEECRRIPWD